MSVGPRVFQEGGLQQPVFHQVFLCYNFPVFSPEAGNIARYNKSVGPECSKKAGNNSPVFQSSANTSPVLEPCVPEQCKKSPVLQSSASANPRP